MPTRPAVTQVQLSDGGHLVIDYDQPVEISGEVNLPAFQAKGGGGSAVVAVSVADLTDNRLELQLGGGDQSAIVPIFGAASAIDPQGIVGVDGGLDAFPFVGRSMVPRIVSITYHTGANTVTVVWSEEANHDVTGTLKVRTLANVPRTVGAPSAGDGTPTWTCPTTGASNTVPIGQYIAQEGVATSHLGGFSVASAGPMAED